MLQINAVKMCSLAATAGANTCLRLLTKAGADVNLTDRNSS